LRKISNFDVPSSYNENKIKLMVRDPFCLYLYWEITDYRRNLIAHHFRCQWEDLKPIIRLYDVTGNEFNGHNANYYVEIPIDNLADNWYINNISPERVFVAEYGVLNPQKEYLPIMCSSPSSTPRDREADIPIPIIMPAVHEHEQRSFNFKLAEKTFSSYSFYENKN
jgi:uncharacterized protein